MCEITGMVDLKNFVRENRDVFLEMTRSLPSSGSVDVWFSTFVGLGTKGSRNEKQPLQKKVNGNMYSIVFSGSLNNGEEVNHQLLKKGHSFQKLSEVETVITAYIEWRGKCVGILEGDFVFAIWDDAKQQLFITRSSNSESTLFYIHHSQFFHFGSNMAPIVNFRRESTEMVEELPLGHSLLFSNGVTKLIKN